MALFIEPFALGGQRGAARGADKQPDAKLVFQLLHAAADGGPADAQPVAGLGEVAFDGHGDEGHDARIAGGEAVGQGIWSVDRGRSRDGCRHEGGVAK
ncbi:hypothetical protein D3C71_1592910 [compost metagenome]